MSEVAYAYKDERPYEIIGGVTYMMSRPKTNHMRVNKNISSIFRNYLKSKTCESFTEEELYLSDEDKFIPDEMIVCNPEIVEEDGVHGVPDLVVEITSPSTARRDRMEKFSMYEKYEVKEYWIVFPQEKRIEVYLLKENKFVIDNVYSVFKDFEWKELSEEAKEKEKLYIKVSLYNDLYVNVEEIFDRVK